jgi:DNA-binding protein Fis
MHDGDKFENAFYSFISECLPIKPIHRNTTIISEECNTIRVQNYRNALKEFQRSYFQKLLNVARGNKSMAAQIAGLTDRGLRKILKRLE